MTTETTDTLLLRHLRSLVGQAVCLHRGDDTPIGKLLDLDAGHALLETGDGDLVLLPLDGLDRVESGPWNAAELARKRWMHGQYGERMARVVQESEERSLLEKLEMIDSGKSPLEELAERMAERMAGKSGGGRR